MFNDYLKVNFQPTVFGPVPGYDVDGFDGFGLRANGMRYGWVLESSVLDADGTKATPIDKSQYPSNAVTARSGPTFEGLDPRLASYAHFDLPTYPARAAWEVAVPNGFYEVTVSVGDTAGPLDSVYDLKVEGVTASQFTPVSTFRTELSVVTVRVTDGFLTLAAPSGKITELQYLEIRSLKDLTPGDGNPAPADYPSFTGLRAAAQDGDEVFETDLDPATGFASGVDPDADIFLGVATVPGRTGIAFESLNDGSIRLYETLTGIEVPYSANTTAGADSVTVTPSIRLEEKTSYTLVVEGAVDRGPIEGSDLTPREFRKVATTFVTGEARDPETGGAAFTDTLELDGFADGAFGFTSVEISPDGEHLYVSNIVGEVKRWEIDPVTGAIDARSVETFAPGGDFDTASGRRGIIGLTFDPVDPNVLWVSDNWPIPLDGRDNSVPDFSGRISRIELGAGGSLADAKITPYVTGLPRSNSDHVVNSLEFRANPDAGRPGEPSHLLYVNVGSNSAMGAPDSAWGLRPERLLSAATLEIDPSRVPPAGGFDLTTEPLPANGLNRRFADTDGDLKNGGIAIDSGPYLGKFLHFDANGVATVREGTNPTSALVESFYDPFAPDAVARIFAAGARNAYDLVWHSNGSLYVPTNGSAAGGNAADDPSTPNVNETLTNISIRPDYLFRMVEGGFYGHPNPLHDRYVLNGGNPTAGEDPGEVLDYAVGVVPDPDYDAANIYDLGFSRSPNGAVEYTSDAWGGAFRGTLLFTEYSGGNTIRAVTLDAAGLVSDDFVLRNFAGDVIDFYVDPLDITINPETGQLYVVTLDRASGASQLVRLDPSPPATRIEAEDMTVVRGFTVAGNASASGGAQLQASNSGPQEASFTWTGPSGLYTLSLGYFDENDGVAQLFTRVDGRLVDAFYWDEDRGTANGNGAAATQENLPNIYLENGSVVSFEGLRNGGEPLRFDYADVSFTSAVTGGEAAPVIRAPSSVSAKADTPFSFSGAREISVSDADSAQLTTVVSAASGTLSLGGTAAADVFGNGTGRIVVSGDAAKVDAALASLSYRAEAGFSGPTSLTLTTTDGHLVSDATIRVDVQGAGDPNAEIEMRSLDPVFLTDRLHFNWIDEPDSNTGSRGPRSYKEEATVRLSNEGTSDLDILGHTLDGPFALLDPTQLDGLTIAPGAFVDVGLRFDRALFDARPNNRSAVIEGSLVLDTNDRDDNQVTVELAALWQRKDEGSWEPNINEIWEVFGFSNRIPGLPFIDSEPSPLNALGVYGQFDQNEILSPYWKIADDATEATITHIGQWAGPDGREVAVHRPFNRGIEVIRIDTENPDSQRLLPRLRPDTSFKPDSATFDPVYSQVTFTRASIPDNWQGDDVFGFDIANFSSDPSINPTGTTTAAENAPEAVLGHWTRVFQALDRDGLVIPNTYLAVQDYAGSNGDYNDNLVILQGVAPASHAPDVSAPAAITVGEDASFAFAGANLIGLTDVDGADMTREFNLVLRAGHGTLSVTGQGGTVVSGSGTGELVIDGARGDTAGVLQTLGTLVYRPDANFSGSDTIRVLANDAVLTGNADIAVTVTEGSDDAPVAQSLAAANITAAGGTNTTVSVTYYDDRALDFSSFDRRDIVVQGPNGGALGVTAASVAPDGAQGAVVTYAVNARGGTWDGSDNGTYTVFQAANQVFDNGARAAAAVELGKFVVDIPLAAPVRVEAEAMNFTSGFSVNSSSAASGGKFLKATSDAEQRAGFVFGQADGAYRVTIGYFDETDGVSRMRLLVNGAEIDAFDWDSTLGSANGNTDSFTTYAIDGVALRAGDLVELAGIRDGGEPLRTDYLEMQRTGPIGTAPPPPPPPPPSQAPFRVQAEAMTLVSGFGVESNGAASGGQAIRSVAPGPKTAQYTFAAADGVYDIAIGHFDETDGVSSMGVYVNGIGVGSWLWNSTSGSANGNAASFLERAFTGITLRSGDVVELRGESDASEPLRTDYVDFTYVKPAGGDARAPVVLSAKAPDLTAGDAGKASTVVSVTYGDDVAIDVSTVDAGDVAVTGPGGRVLTVTGVSVDASSDGTPRTVAYTVAAPGGTWDPADNGTYTVALAAGAVEDTSGNAIAASASIARFTVDATPPAPAPFRVQAEAMTLVSGFGVESNGAASGGQLIRSVAPGPKTADYAFSGAEGVYTISVAHFDENDGQSSLSVLVNGETVDSFVWNRDAAGATANANSFSIYDVTGVTLSAGDVVRIDGVSDGGEPLRVDYLDFAYEGALL